MATARAVGGHVHRRYRRVLPMDRPRGDSAFFIRRGAGAGRRERAVCRQTVSEGLPERVNHQQRHPIESDGREGGKPAQRVCGLGSRRIPFDGNPK